MKSSDRSILVGVVVIGLLAAFWFLVLSPKREEAGKLDDEIAALRTSIGEQEELAAAGEQAKAGYKDNYHRLVVLGKAAPSDDDAASLIEQTQALAARAGIDFRSIVLAQGAAAADAAPAPEPPPPADAGTTEESVPAAVPATETAAATTPIGATIGPAGLPTMPYDLDFRGDFFEIADFMAELDEMVRTTSKGPQHTDPGEDPDRVGVDGRLLTVDGFVLSADLERGFPHLDADLHVTSYVVPADQGVTAGATEAAPATAPVTAPAETTTPAATASP